MAEKYSCLNTTAHLISNEISHSGNIDFENSAGHKQIRCHIHRMFVILLLGKLICESTEFVY